MWRTIDDCQYWLYVMGLQCPPEVCEESLGEGRSQREVGTNQLGQEDRGKTEGKSGVFVITINALDIGFDM